MDCKGVKLSMQIVMVLLCLGSGIRCIPTESKQTFTLLVHAGQFLNGLAGPIAMSIPPVISATFFPTEQRTLATSVMSVANYVGVAISFIGGPAIVNNPDHVEHKVFTYLAGQTALCLLGFIGVMMYVVNCGSGVHVGYVLSPAVCGALVRSAASSLLDITLQV
jgi:hypothetical protein